MFHATQALLLIKEIYPKSHKGVIQKFGEKYVKSGLLEKKWDIFWLKQRL